MSNRKFATVVLRGCSRAGSSLARSVTGELVLEKNGVRVAMRAFGFATKHLQLLKFNAELIKSGISRVVYKLPEPYAP